MSKKLMRHSQVDYCSQNMRVSCVIIVLVDTLRGQMISGLLKHLL